MQISGTVTQITSKQVPNKNNPGTFYTFYTALINGTPVNIGFNSGPAKGSKLFAEGMNVTIQTTPGFKNEHKYVEGSLNSGGGNGSNNNGNVVNRSTASTTPAVVSGDRELSIIRQSSLKAAVEVVNAMTGIKALEDKVSKILELANTFTNYASGKTAVEEVKKLVTKAEPGSIEDDVNG